MSICNKTEATLFPMQTMLPYGVLFSQTTCDCTETKISQYLWYIVFRHLK